MSLHPQNVSPDEFHGVAVPSFAPEVAAYAAEMLKAVAHPLRLRILALLSDRPHNVTEMSRELDAVQAIVSQQLRILRSHRLVDVSRRGGFATYSLAEPSVRKLLWCVSGCLGNEGNGAS